MASPTIVRHYPRGGVEYAYGSEMPQVGDVLNRFDGQWAVVSVVKNRGLVTVTLAPHETPAEIGEVARATGYVV